MKDPERHRLALRLFDELCDMPPDRRATVLAERTEGDPELRRTVEALLQHDSTDDRFLDADQPGQWLGAMAADVLEDDPVATPTTIGPYRIVGKIGEGGMGIIYEALQESPRRRVALKVLRPGMMNQGMLRRFQHEAHVLGQLQHPGIAQIYEAGVAQTPLGRQPYLVMERIDGQPLDLFANAHELDINQRLELMARVCDAVQHAHQKGIIHRDLKPNNLLVVERANDGGNTPRPGTSHTDAIGQPKVLDFGVARATEPGLSGVTALTEAGQLIGTLAYMSPEQLGDNPGDLDVRSDVYSLGVVLYELLSGRLPHDIRNRALPDAARMILEEEPSRLRSFDRAFRGDIDTMLSKALERDRERRYQAPADLAADIRRYLAHEPLQARPVSSLYQFRKFARRNKALVFGIAATMAACVIGAGIATYFAVRANRNAQLAGEREARSLRASYRASIAAAAAALRENDVPGAEGHLAAAPASLRDWDFEHLTSRLDQSFGAAKILPDDQPPARVQYLRGRMHVWMGADGETVHVVSRRDNLGRSAISIQSWDTMAQAAPPPDSLKNVAVFAPVVGRDAILVITTDEHASIRSAETGERIRDLPAFENLPRSRIHIPQQVPASEALPALGAAIEAMAAEGFQPSHAAISADGRRIAGWFRKDLRVFDRERPNELTSIEQHDEGVSNAAFSPDGRFLATTGFNRRLALYDLDAGGVLVWARPDAHRDAILALAISPDGSTLATGGEDRVLKLWDTASGRPVATRIGHRHPILAVSFGSDRTRVVSSSAEQVRAWRFDPDGDPFVMQGHEWFVNGLALSPDGTMLASSGRETRLWDAPTGLLITRLPATPNRNSRTTFSADGGRLLVKSTVFDLRSGRELVTLDGPAETHAFEPGGRFIVSKGTRRGADSYRQLAERSFSGVWTLGPSGRYISMTRRRDNLVAVYEVESQVPFVQFTYPVNDASLVIDEGRMLAVGTVENGVGLLDLRSERNAVELKGHGDWVQCFVEFPQRRILASGGWDRTIRLWNLDTLGEMVDLRGHLDNVNGLVVTPDGQTLFSASGDRTVRRWDTRPARDILRARDHYRAFAAGQQPVIDACFERLGDADAVADQLLADDTLTPRERTITSQLILRTSIARDESRPPRVAAESKATDG